MPMTFLISALISAARSEIKESDDFVECSRKVMTSHDIDVEAVDACVVSSYKNQGKSTETNTMLDTEIADRKEYALLTLPTAIVNGRELRGQTQYGTTMETNVARAVCVGFETLPVECDQILNPNAARPTVSQIRVSSAGSHFWPRSRVKSPSSGDGPALTTASPPSEPETPTSLYECLGTQRLMQTRYHCQ